jgi:CHAT domain
MIQVALEIKDLFPDKLDNLTISLTNVSQEVLTNIVFGLKLPSSVRFQKGLRLVKIQQLKPNEVFKHIIEIVPISEGMPELTIYNFSYRNAFSRTEEMEDMRYPITVQSALPVTSPPLPRPIDPDEFIENTPEGLNLLDYPQKILILSAIPHRLRLDKEIREIEEAIRRSVNRDSFEIRVRMAVRPQDVRRAVEEEEPQIVHFCGHGREDGSILLEDDEGNDKPVAPEGLASLFQLHTDYVKCVVLNACYSEKSAAAISQYINYAIGINQPIEDKAAIAFARGFYDGISYKKSANKDVFQRAFEEAVVAIKLENISRGQIPVLKTSFQKI